LEESLVKEGFIGQIDLNAILSEDHVFGLEWTPRFGYDSTPSFIPLVDGDLGKLYSDFAMGQGSMELIETFSAGVRLTIPPYPVEHESNVAIQKVSPNYGIPIRGFKESQFNNLYFYEVTVDVKGGLIHADGPGVIAVVNSLEDDPTKAFENTYEIIESAKIPDVQYRTDLSELIPKMYKKIERRLHYARG
jgi:phosphoribosylamine-glycine ligase